MQVINLFSGPGGGKSTVASGLFYHMKMQHKNVELVTEFAKDLVYSQTLSILKDNQEFIFAEQNRRLHILEGKVDYAITDSPLLLSHIYGVGRGRFNQESFLHFVSDTFRMYNNINFFLERPANFTEAGRAHNLQESIEIDNLILKVLKQEYVEFVRIPTNKHAVDRILSHLIL